MNLFMVLIREQKQISPNQVPRFELISVQFHIIQFLLKLIKMANPDKD